MNVAASAGYSGKPLWQKLGLKDGTRLYVADAPATWPRLLAGAPQGLASLPGVVTDVTENAVRAVALPMGIVDVKVCAIDATWSGLKLVRRRAP